MELGSLRAELLEANKMIPCPVVVAPTAKNLQCASQRRGFHCAALRLQDQSKSDKPPSSSSTTYHQHYQAHSTEQDTAAASQGDPASEPAADEASRPNTRRVDTNVSSQHISNMINISMSLLCTVYWHHCRSVKSSRYWSLNSSFLMHRATTDLNSCHVCSPSLCDVYAETSLFVCLC